jgi:hypothetical protein
LTGGVCQLCNIPGCATCSGFNQCSACNSNTVYTNAITACYVCDLPNCLSCSANSFCQTCNQSSFLPSSVG